MVFFYHLDTPDIFSLLVNLCGSTLGLQLGRLKKIFTLKPMSMFYYFMICEFDQNFYLIVSIDAIWKFKSNAFVLCTMHVPYSQIILHKGKKTPIGLQTKELYNLLKSLRI